MLRVFYSVALYLILPFALLYFCWRGWREPAYLRGWGQRLGFFSNLPRGSLWVHAASVGEVQAALPLIKALRETYPETPLLVTVFTPTGLARAQSELGHDCHICYLPLDLPHATASFVRAAQPRMGIIVETELWPNLLFSCGAHNVPVVLVNAQLSASSAARYQRWPVRGLLAQSLQNLTCVAVASAQDAQTFTQLGINPNRIVNAGNLKFDLQLPQGIGDQGRELRAQWQAQDRDVWVAASTHPGEEEIVLEAFRGVLAAHPHALLVLVPRHPQRFASVHELCRRLSFTTVLRSREDVVDASVQVLLGDTLGELTSFYAAADVAVIGGSLVEGIGGHNLLEPAALELPLIVGPHLADVWADVADRMEAVQALNVAADASALSAAVNDYFENPERRRNAGAAAAQSVTDHGGALAKTLEMLALKLAPERGAKRLEQ